MTIKIPSRPLLYAAAFFGVCFLAWILTAGALSRHIAGVGQFHSVAGAILGVILWLLMATAFLATVAENEGLWLIIKWYDGWVGYYVDQKNHKLYILPVPYIGLVLGYTER